MRYVLILSFSIFVAYGSHAQSKTEMFLTEAGTYLKNAQYDVALGKIQEVLKLEPGNKEALQMQINVYYLQDDYKEAYSLVEKALDKYPDESEFYYQRGLIYIGRQKYEKAVDDFNKVISMNGTDLYKVYLNRGIANMNMMEYERATEDFSKSIDLNGNNASAYHTRGMLNYQLKDYNASVKDFKKALEINSDNPETSFNLGMSYFRLEDLDNACPYFQKACKEGNVNACKMVLMECAKNLPK